MFNREEQKKKKVQIKHGLETTDDNKVLLDKKTLQYNMFFTLSISLEHKSTL